jgi:protein-histidine pros-kinase
MSLLFRINLAFGAVFVLAMLIAGFAGRSILEANARREVFAEAGLMMDSAWAIRDYTANEILPLLGDGLQNVFPPQRAFYAATQNFLRLRARHPTTRTGGDLNRESARSAGGLESDIIQLQNDALPKVMRPRCQWAGALQPGPSATMQCAAHSTPSVAPRNLIALRQRQRPGWQTEIVAPRSSRCRSPAQQPTPTGCFVP